MDTMTIFSVIGTFASLGGAVVAIWQAAQSRSAADEADRIRSQLVGHRETSELTQVQGLCKKALKSMEKYGPGSVPSSLAGVSQGSDAVNLQEFVFCLKEQREHFGLGQSNEADQFYDVIMPVLDAFAQATTPNELRKNGTLILSHLGSISATIKRLLDSKLETAR